MKANGYSTYMSGKWHVTVDGAFDTPNGSYPTNGDLTNITVA